MSTAPDSYFGVTAQTTRSLWRLSRRCSRGRGLHIIAVGTLDGGDAHDFTVRVFTDNEEGIQSVDLVPVDL